jgi:hypothetical protein
MKVKLLVLVLLLYPISKIQAQSPLTDLGIPEEKVSKFYPYMQFMYGTQTAGEMKNSNPVKYYQELWYHCESFYVVRNYATEGIELNEEIFDIKRFEHLRKQNEEVTIQLDGFKDVIVLLPITKVEEKKRFIEQYFKDNK